MRPKILIIFFSVALYCVSLHADDHGLLYDVKLINWLRSNVSFTSGMPLSFGLVDPPKDIFSRIGRPNSVTSIVERVIVNEGVSVYDAAVWQIVLAYTGEPSDLVRSRLPISYYWKGSLGDLSDIRSGSGRQSFVYDPQDPGAVTVDGLQPGRRGFIFRIINAHGKYLSADPLDGKSKFAGFPNGSAIHWEDWKPVAGENAWVVMAALHVLSRRSSAGPVDTRSMEFRLAEELARAALYLQADNGGIRMTPLGTFHIPLDDTTDLSETEVSDKIDRTLFDFQGTSLVNSTPMSNYIPFYPNYLRFYYEEISTENNLSWYAAFRMLWQLTGDKKYHQAMTRIESYLQSAWDPDQRVFHQGMHYFEGQWVPNKTFFATDVQTWALVVLGPELIDQWFGAGAARDLWYTTKQKAGRFDKDGRLLGVGFTTGREQLSVEWTAGAILAVRKLVNFYGTRSVHADNLLVEDERHMRAGVEFLRQNLGNDQAAYSYSERRDWIPFGWFAHDKSVVSLASTGWIALIDAGIDPFQLPSNSR